MTAIAGRWLYDVSQQGWLMITISRCLHEGIDNLC